jgi:exopolyphosphatase / guanosine-5'-triphosphate,3'-diphosphate pyrophosphatase
MSQGLRVANHENAAGVLMPSGTPGQTGNPVIPRWEWRVFERTFAGPPAEDSPGTPPAEQTYVLSLLSPHSVKVRDGMLDIKRLERVEATGLQLWRPVLQAPFPIAASALAAACSAWGIHGPAPDTPPLSLSDLLERVVVPHRQLRIVTLSKRRLPITIGRCQGERAQITIGRHRWNTVSVEHDDRRRVLGALGELGLEPSANEDYPRALKRIMGLPDHSSEPRVLPVL